MANYVSVVVDTDLLSDGKFHTILVDGNGNSVVIPTMTIKKYQFTNIKYFECPEPYDNYSSFHIWSKVESNGIERFEEITSSLQINKTKRNDKWYLSFESNVPVSGEIIFD